MRGYLWEDLSNDVSDEFARLSAKPARSKGGGSFKNEFIVDVFERMSEPAAYTDRHTAFVIKEQRMLMSSERYVARQATGDEWLGKLAAAQRMAARKRYAEILKEKKIEAIGRPRGGALVTPRLEEKRAKDRARQERRAMRERLPDLREGVTWNFTIHTREKETVEGHLTTGLYADGRVGEIFVKMDKEGSAGAWIDMWAISASMLLQNGVPLETICKKFLGMRFDPAGGTESKDVPRCTSVVDLVSRYLLFRYCKETT